MDSRNSGGLYEHFLKIHIPLSHITFPFHNIYECSYILKMCTNACHKQRVKKIHITFHHFDHTPSPSLAWTKSKPSGELSLGASCHFLIRFCRAVSHVAEVTGRSSLILQSGGTSSGLWVFMCFCMDERLGQYSWQMNALVG